MHGIRRSGQFVTPGDKLGVIEEFIPDSGTYVENGSIYASITGHILLDLINRKISVYPSIRKVYIPRIGSIVIGNVVNVQDQLATIRIIKIGRKSLQGFFTGILHISEVSFRYTESMLNVCKVGDITKTRVISDKNGVFHLSMKGSNYGVIYAFCSQCGGFLAHKRQGKMQCVECGNVERRKVSADYGEIIL